jgi:putative ABC transport system permease protein
MASLDFTVPITNLMPYDERIQSRFWVRRLGAVVVATLSLCAVVLAAVGLYGVMTYFVDQRRADIAVRIALGATPTNIAGLVLLKALRLIGYGIAVGLVATWTIAHIGKGMLYQVSTLDPTAILATFLVLGTTAALACLGPVLRAVYTEPTRCLRD